MTTEERTAYFRYLARWLFRMGAIWIVCGAFVGAYARSLDVAALFLPFIAFAFALAYLIVPKDTQP